MNAPAMAPGTTANASARMRRPSMRGRLARSASEGWSRDPVGAVRSVGCRVCLGRLEGDCIGLQGGGALVTWSICAALPSTRASSVGSSNSSLLADGSEYVSRRSPVNA